MSTEAPSLQNRTTVLLRVKGTLPTVGGCTALDSQSAPPFFQCHGDGQKGASGGALRLRVNLSRRGRKTPEMHQTGCAVTLASCFLWNIDKV